MTDSATSVNTTNGAAAYLPEIEAGTLTIYQLYDVGDEIDLNLAQNCLAQTKAYRSSPPRVRQSKSIEIAQPPLRVELGTVTLALEGMSLNGKLHASIYDLGAVAIAAELSLPQPTSWATVADLVGDTLNPLEVLLPRFLSALEELERILQSAIALPHRAAIVEDYTVIIVERLTGNINLAAMSLHPVVKASLLGEKRQLSDDAMGLIVSMSYYPNDLALLSWNGALLIEPEPLAAATAVALIEFANVQLLLMRTYDAELDTQLPQMYQRIAREQQRFELPLVRRYSQLLHDVQSLVAEVTQVTERVDNALKVTDDVYWNRLYSALLNVLRVDVWRDGVEHKLALIRETYSMLHAEADAERASALEWTIVLLILFEIGMALLGH
jgi:hypothetical protein